MRTLLAPALWLALSAACGGGSPSTSAPDGAQAPADARRVHVIVSVAGYTPDAVDARPGETLVLVFERPDAHNCGEELVFPDTGRTVALPVGTTEVVVTAPSEGRLSFTCGMGMYQGAVVVSS